MGLPVDDDSHRLCKKFGKDLLNTQDYTSLQFCPQDFD